MKTKLTLVAALVAIVAVSDVSAAMMNITNKGSRTATVGPIWNGFNEKVILEPGQSKQYNSGFNEINGVYWEQEISCSSRQSSEGVFCLKRFQMQMKIPFASLGGQFDIFNDGSFAYKFDTLGGSGNGVATIIKAQGLIPPA